MNEIKLKTIRIPVFRTKIEEEELQLFDINKEDMVRFVCEKSITIIAPILIKLY